MENPSLNQKDFFSAQAGLYAAFRPTYPDDLYDFILQHVAAKNVAWDCATGNGQVARHLAHHFKKMIATDISEKQLELAYLADNIFYSVSAAEKTLFNHHEFDLITVGQAFHWFDHEKFYEEVSRVIKPSGILALFGYSLPAMNDVVDPILLDFYTQVVGPYWDSARRWVEDGYESIHIPFSEIKAPRFDYATEWTLPHLEGYLNSWSSTQLYIRENNKNPVPPVMLTIRDRWKEEKLMVHFPIFLRLFKVD